jgi:site-specific DNA recombinase
MPTIAIYARKSTESEDRQILSIDSQVRELKEYARREDLAIIHVLTESRSAKAPGRPVFNELFGLVQRGRVDGVLCWKLDRLARNPVDGGAVIWAMEERKLTAIHTPQRAFTNTGNDKFWMQLEFGMAKKYVDDLSDNVKRGIRAKLELGWISGLPPLGYLNDPTNRIIVKDPVRFPLVRRMWDFMLSGKHTPPQILQVATAKWGLRTRQFKRIGGKPLARSAVYELFKNPFYYGTIVRKGEYYQGKHPAMITKSEFDRVQSLLGVSTSPRPQQRTFAYTGLIRCGECGASVTAEHKRNRYGSTYVYYHCTKRKPGVACTQRVIEVKELERQVEAFLQSITITAKVRDWAIKQVRASNDEEAEKDRVGLEALNKQHSTCKRQLSELVDLRLRGLLSDDEYIAKKRQLEEERARLDELLKGADGRFVNVLGRCVDVFDFARRATTTFAGGSLEDKRAILRFTGSNLVLKDRILSIQPQKPLFFIQRALSSGKSVGPTLEPSDFCEPQRQIGESASGRKGWCTLVDDVRTYFLCHPNAPSFRTLPSHIRPQSKVPSPDSPAKQSGTGDSTAPAPSVATSWSSSQSRQLRYGAWAGALHCRCGKGGP